MNRGNLYAVFFLGIDDRPRWAASTNRRRAIAFARLNKGEVGVIAGAALAVNEFGRGWDAPTFRALMTPVRDFRVCTSSN